jgi:hypothetical protein
MRLVLYGKGSSVIPIDKFTIQEHEGKYEDRPLKSLLYFNDEELNVKVSGFVIEKQYELPNYFLLLVNWDCPFEEGCEVVVLNKNFEIIGSHSFTPFYNSYLLSSVNELSCNHYKLVFNESDCFELVINYPKKSIFSKVVSVSKLAV